MLGRYYIDIGNKHKKFHIEIEHRINIIKGNSASGKTTLIKFIEQFIRSGKSSGIKCDTNADNLVVLNLGDDYESKISIKILIQYYLWKNRLNILRVQIL